MVRGGQSNVPPFPSGLGGNSDQMFRELYARVHGAETRVLTVQGEDVEGPEVSGFSVLSATPVKTVVKTVHVQQGNWRVPEPFEAAPVLMTLLNRPAIVLGIQVEILEPLNRPMVDDQGVILRTTLRVGVNDFASRGGVEDSRAYFAISDILDEESVPGSALGAHLVHRLVQFEPVDRVGTLIGQRVTSVLAGFLGTRPDGRPPILDVYPDQEGKVAVTVTYVDSTLIDPPGTFLDLAFRLLASEPL